jgi:tetratricopeptide (TPR) repeat protein
MTSIVRSALKTKSPFLSHAAILRISGLCLLVAACLTAESVSAGADDPAFRKVVTIIERSRMEAEQQIIALHGQSTFSLLKDEVVRNDPSARVPSVESDHLCPGLGFTDQDVGVVVTHAGALNQAGAYFLTGMEALLNGYPQMAKWCFAVAAVKAPACSAYLSNLAFVLNGEGHFVDASVLLEYAKLLDPGESSIYVNLAFSYQNLKMFDKAIQALLFAISLHPTFQKYQDMLLGLQDMRKAEEGLGPRLTADKKDDKSQKPVQLDDALRLLEEHKKKDFEEEVSSGLRPLPSSGVRPRKSIQPPRRYHRAAPGRLNPEIFGHNRSECVGLSKQAYVLERAGDEIVTGMGLSPAGGNPVDKFISAGHAFLESREEGSGLEDIARAGRLTIAMAFYGKAGEVYLECRSSEEWGKNRGEVNRLFDKARADAERAHRELVEEITKKEKFGKTVCTGKVCFSKGEDGTIKLEVSELFGMVGGVEVRLNPTKIYRCGLKISRGLQVQVGVGDVAQASASAKYYVDCTFGSGCSRGAELGVDVQGGKGVKVKGTKSFDVIKYLAENSPGS